MKTVLEVLRAGDQFLAAKGVPDSRREVERLLMWVLQLGRVELYCGMDRPLQEEELARLREAVERRSRREPLAYIQGSVDFFGMEIAVDRRVLIPRMETEHLVDRMVSLLRSRAPGRLLDLCTGSGCIALAIKKALPAWEVCASDLCPQALECARQNASRLGLAVEWRQGDLADPWKGGSFDCVVCNPPYVAETWRDQLEPEVERWEPEAALFSGPQGLDVLNRLALVTPTLLRPGGELWLEIGFDQADQVESIWGPYGRGTRFQDLEGRDRFFRLEVESQ